MKVYELVAAAVLRVGQNDGSLRALSWTELGQAFGVTKDQVRHQLNRFKEKYNVVDADVTTPGWNREFLSEHTPEAEKSELADAAIIPGDVTIITANGYTTVFVNAKGNTVFLDANGDVQRGFVQNPNRNLSAAKYQPLEEITFNAPVPPQIEPLKFLITPTVLVVIRDGLPLTIDKSHKNFTKIQQALESGEWQNVLDFIDMKNTLTKYSNGRVKIEDGRVTLDGETIHGKVVERLVNCLLEENLESLEALTAFLDKCDENPDFRVVTRIYDFMAHNDLRLDKDGNILAYKVVKHDYKDKYTGTMDNSPGALVQMKRNKVNPKDEETCSHGLHVAAKKYIPQYGSPSMREYGDRVVLCRVNPKDFVSIPTDYNSMKARVCEYTVLKDVTELFCQDQLETEGIKA
jgi:hypothetical protein